MPVVINEFEAVAEAAPPPTAGGDGGGGIKPLKLHDLARVASLLARRKARIWAH